jgi:GT2 family glycosyltransferase
VSEPVTVIIPHYRAATLCACLAALYAHSDRPVRVLVIDDGDNAPSLQQAQREFPQIEVLRNERNLGFSASCNRGLEAACTRYAVLLNDDTRVAPRWLGPLVDRAESDPAIGACQPKLLSATRPDFFDYGGAAGGYIDALGYTFCRGRIFDHCERDQGQYDGETPLFWACGSALFLRLEAVRQVGLLDLDYFMHFEEIDLCWRLQLAGYRIWAVPRSVVYHHSGFSLPPSSLLKAYLNHRNNLVMLCKNLPAGRLLWVLLLRFFLEIFAALAYLCRGQWSSVPAPLLASCWCLAHPGNIRRRRRQSQAIRRVPFSSLRDGLYRGSLLYQHFIRRICCTWRLMPEGPLR